MLAAAIQMTSTADRAHNEARALDLVAQAADRGARLIGLPEVWEHIGPAQQKKAFAGPLEGRQLAPLREFCTKRAIWLVAGSIAERAHENDARIYNTTALISPKGELVAAYRKMHLFDVDIPDGARYRESETVAPGPSLPPVAELREFGMKIGLSVCYDLRFPELYRTLSDAGADILCVPAAFTAYTGRSHWEILLRARAIENQAYVFAPAQVGRIGPSNENRFAWGHACIIDPWGEVLADSGGDGEGIALAKLESARIAQVRRDLPALKHRRRDLL
ncbi:MAG: carbon-nitrogen hydrolase family protein [Myxococcales bacterium]|nr:carbon-nitrogen hydrolase family protein [Myxococcales bacterium]